ncbi:MAG: MBL fold metallo-hydrolase [Oscillospiraceae bacterium]|nr:MBL fold metallo-hydrolase [Oscillospiraceae bacterium]
MDASINLVKIKDGIWLLEDTHNGTAYVVEGTEKAMVIDTCNGYQDFKACVRELTDRPLIVVNTHAHRDHTGGNRFFEKTYICRKEYEDAQGNLHLPEGAGEIEFIKEGDSFDLGGGRVLEVIEFAGHTPGGVCLLDRADRLLFTGDSILGRTVWMFMPNSVTIETLRHSLDHIDEYRADFDYLLTGHGVGLDSPSLIDELKTACDSILSGTGRLGEAEIRDKMRKVCFYCENSTLVYEEDKVR